MPQSRTVRRPPSFGNDMAKEVNENITAMKVKHLLTMSTGHVKDTIQPMRHSSEAWAKTFFSQPVERQPGTFFLYNTGATYMLSAIVQKLTGQPLIQYLRPRLFDPLGIEGEDWETDPQGINTGGYGLRVKTEDIAKFGQLYLQKGKWNGKQILSSAWIDEATKTQINSNSSNPSRPKEEDDWAQGYGYQFWRCRPGGYRADGAFGQFSMVMPDYDAVIAITGESFSMQKSMDLVWSFLLPAMDKAKRSLPADVKSQSALKQTLSGLRLDPIEKNATSPVAARISGKDFMLDTNDFNAKVNPFVCADSMSRKVIRSVLSSIQVTLAASAVGTSIRPATGNGVPFLSFFCSTHLWTPQVTCCFSFSLFKLKTQVLLFCIY